MDVRLLADAMYQRGISAGQRIVCEGEIVIIVSGTVERFRITQGMLAEAGHLGPGDAFGEESFFDSDNGMVYRAKDAVVIFVISEQTFDAIAVTHPRVLYELLRKAHRPVSSLQPAYPKVVLPAPRGLSDVEGESASLLSSTSQQEVSSTLFPLGHKNYPGVTHPEYLQYAYVKEYKCPFCQKMFKGFKPFESKLKIAQPMRFDLREYFVGFQMEWYDVVTCPHCYMSALSAFFGEPRTFVRRAAQETVKELKNIITLNFTAEREINFVFAAHYLALRCASAFTNNRQLTAKLWSNLSWLYEDMQDDAMTKLAAANAAKAQQDLFSSSKLTPAQEQTVSLAVAGMLYRAGEFGDIKKWLYQAKTSKGGQRAYMDLADDLANLIDTR